MFLGVLYVIFNCCSLLLLLLRRPLALHSLLTELEASKFMWPSLVLVIVWSCNEISQEWLKRAIERTMRSHLFELFCRSKGPNELWRRLSEFWISNMRDLDTLSNETYYIAAFALPTAVSDFKSTHNHVLIVRRAWPESSRMTSFPQTIINRCRWWGHTSGPTPLNGWFWHLPSIIIIFPISKKNALRVVKICYWEWESASEL